jgi:hypothetical protein
MLNKNAQERPSVAQILQMPIVRQKMIDFVNNGGLTSSGGGPSSGIYIKNNPTLVKQQSLKPQQPAAKVYNEEEELAKLTPKERMAKKKELETLRKIEEAKNYAVQASQNYAKAQEMKY